jgi:hypothetical protein
MKFNIHERIKYIKSELASNRHDGWVSKGLKEELAELEKQLER